MRTKLFIVTLLVAITVPFLANYYVDNYKVNIDNTEIIATDTLVEEEQMEEESKIVEEEDIIEVEEKVEEVEEFKPYSDNLHGYLFFSNDEGYSHQVYSADYENVLVNLNLSDSFNDWLGGEVMVDVVYESETSFKVVSITKEGEQPMQGCGC